jgi:hypothetical protein
LIKVAAFADDSLSGKLSTIHGIVIRRKVKSQEIYKRVGYMYKEMPEDEVSGYTQPRDIILV